MLRGWIKEKKSTLHGSTNSLNTAAELQDLDAAMKAVTFIMNDDLESAAAGLEAGTSSFHKLGQGMVAFLRATLGFEPEIIREASECLAGTETTASIDHRRAQKDPEAFHSSIYAPGSEFALCLAQSQLMSAVVGVLNENLLEGIKGFYKLRKAYISLDSILAAERKFTESTEAESNFNASRTSYDSHRTNGSVRSVNGIFGDKSASPGGPLLSPHGISAQHNGMPKSLETQATRDVSSDDDSDEFVDADENHEGLPTPSTYLGHVDTNEATDDLAKTSIGIPKTQMFREPSTPYTPRSPTKSMYHMLEHDPDSDVFTNPLDSFIHSGANLCFGLLLVLLSMIPPAFNKLLFIIGFKGDKPRGIRMLWQATKFFNINGAMAGLILLGYYNGLVGFCDIIPDSHSNDEDPSLESVEGYPTKRCEGLLHEMRTRYPKSRLWLLEEARMLASKKHLDKAIALLSSDIKSPLKQVEALSMFEKSLNSMYSHRYDLCSQSFVECCELNNWSHALYYYIAGSAHVELYRRAKADNDEASAAQQAERAIELLHKVRENAGKKKFMARQLPFDIFVVRKLNKWEARAKEWNVSFIDAIGISPFEEMIYFWNGHKRMDREQLQHSLSALAWSEDPSNNPHWHRESLDENAILSFLRAAIYRSQGRHEEAKMLLKKEIICNDRAAFKGHLKDDWTCPTAHYEMGANLWMERDGSEADAARVKEAEQWLDVAAKWEKYELDARMGLKITTGLETLRGWKAENGI
ncbi:Mitochondrial outer membrane protein iml2 [Lambiella insularis]|nr:Mitochondrial outer membrane protein iml2 [Lambiella insularis]